MEIQVAAQSIRILLVDNQGAGSYHENQNSHAEAQKGSYTLSRMCSAFC